MTDSVTEIMARAMWRDTHPDHGAYYDYVDDDERAIYFSNAEAVRQALKDAGYAEPVKQERLDAPLAALREIEAFGSVNTGCGFTCAAKALAAISAWEGNEDT